jgi:hypothetical protein
MSGPRVGAKIHIRLEKDDDGYPPAGVESVWGQPTDTPAEYVVDNVPFFARCATLGDVVQVAEDDQGLWFVGVVRRSGNSLIRVVFFDRSLATSVSKALVDLGCSTEYLAAYGLLAVNVPPEVGLGDVQSYLNTEAGKGALDYEEPLLRQ